MTLPNVKWGLLYGVLLCNARAMGEFEAVTVVSGNIRGVTTTLPLHIEISLQRQQGGGRLRRRLASRRACACHAWRENTAGGPLRRVAGGAAGH